MFNQKEFQTSLNKLLLLINQKSADALLINSEQNRLWLLNLKASAGFIIVSKSGKVNLIIDGRYFANAYDKYHSYINVIELKAGVFEKTLTELNVEKLLIEDEYTNAKEFLYYQKLVKEVDLYSAMGVRILKNQFEINNLQKAADINVEAVEFIKKHAKPGMSEKEISLMVTIKMLELGGEKNSFEPIVASGENGANPHHKNTDRLLQLNEMLTLDCGTVYNGYCSDMTRTWAVANSKLPKELQDMHDAVFHAQQLGLNASIVNKTTKQVDAACRDYLTSVNLSQHFKHSTGHGLGIDIHELPAVSSNDRYDIKLENSMVITVEPGIYIPNVAGLRIEDSVVIQNNNPIILNQKSCKKSNW